jgi:two-component SAPR family response regulator
LRKGLILTDRKYAGIEGLSVFVIEDETLVLVNLEDMLDELGCALVGPAMRLDQADAMLDEAATADVAILDVNIGGRPVFPFAEKLADKGVPLIFATGYGRDGLPPEWQDGTVLGKPYTFDDLAGALKEARGID